MQGDPFPSLWRKLREHTGLSEYEARVYVSLVLMGPSKASDISRVCGVPRTKVYRTLEKLVDQGIISRVSEKPLRFVPESPVKSFEAHVNSFEQRTQDFLSTVSFLKNAYEKTRASTKIDKGEVWIFQGRQEVREKVQEMLSHAQKFVSVTCSSATLVLVYKMFNRTLEEMSERGVKIQVHTPMDSCSESIARELRDICEVRRSTVESPVLVVSVDEREFLVAKLTAQDHVMDGKNPGKDLGIFSTDLNLLEHFSEIFSGSFDSRLPSLARVLSRTHT